MKDPPSKPLPLDYAAPRARRWGLIWAMLAACGIVLAGIGWVVVDRMKPPLSRASETANRVKCAMNLRRIGQAILLYRGEFPDSLKTLILEPTSGLDAHDFLCPSSNDEKPDHATIQELAQKLDARGVPDAYLTAASRPWMHLSYVYFVPGGTRSVSPDSVIVCETPCNHDNDGMNALFGDGHVEFLGKREAARFIAELESGHNPPRKEH